MAGDIQCHPGSPAQPLGRTVEPFPGKSKAQKGMADENPNSPAQGGGGGVLVFFGSMSLPWLCPPRVPQVQQLLSRFLALGGSWTGPLLQEMGGKILCQLREEQIQQIPAAAIG